MPVIGADGEVGGTVIDLWVDRAEALVRYLEVEVAGSTRRVLLPIGFSQVDGRRRCRRALDPGRPVRQVPGLRNPDQITLLEEDRIMRYYGGGTLYAEPSRMEPLAVSGHEHEYEPVPGLPEACRPASACCGRARPTGARWRAARSTCARWRSISPCCAAWRVVDVINAARSGRRLPRRRAVARRARRGGRRRAGADWPGSSRAPRSTRSRPRAS